MTPALGNTRSAVLKNIRCVFPEMSARGKSSLIKNDVTPMQVQAPASMNAQNRHDSLLKNYFNENDLFVESGEVRVVWRRPDRLASYHAWGH